MTNGGAPLWQGVSMKTKSLVLTLFLATTAAVMAQSTNLTSLLQQGLLEEQGNRNFDAAVAAYQSLAALFDQDRKLAATAIFRLGECYRAQGKTNEATAQYQRILREFSDQNTLALMSRQNLIGLGAPPTTALSAPPENQDAKLWESLSHLSDSELEKVLPTLLPDSVLNSLLQERDRAQIHLAELSVQFSINHPDVKQQDASLKIIEDQVRRKVRGMMQALKLRANLSNPTPTPSSVNQNVTETASDEDQEIQRIKQMIQNSPDLINAPNGGATPLHAAANKGQLRVATFLLDHGAEINPKNGETPLYAAVLNAQKTMVELLLNRGADINAPNGADHGTVLGTAVHHGYEAVIGVLLARKADVNLGRPDGFTPLMETAEQGRAKIIRMLLAAKANPNAQDDKGYTPLIYAARAGSTESVKELLAAGAEANAENNNGMPLLSSAVESGSPEIVKMLLAAKADPNAGKVNAPLLCAIHKRDLISAELLLEGGANPNATGDVFLPINTSQGLYIPSDVWTSGSGVQGLVRRQNVAPLWLAIHWDELPMVNLLLKFKADPNNSPDGRPLIYGALRNSEIVQALLGAGAKLNVRDGSYWPLERATADDLIPTAEALLKHGADPNERDADGNTALHIARNHLNQKVYELLLAYHADPNLQNNNGSTPLQWVKTNTARGLEIAQLLRQHGALDNPPHWNLIEVNRLSGRNPKIVYSKGTNDWNHFTLMETILNYYVAGGHPQPQVPGFWPLGQWPIYQQNTMPFPDFAHIVIVRPSHHSTNESRINVNLIDSTNGIDCAKNVPLEYGDMVEIPEREHSLGDPPKTLTEAQAATLLDCLTGHAQLIVHDQKVELALNPFGAAAALFNVLHQPEAQKIILSSSDLSRVKVTRAEAKTGEKLEWMLDCTHPLSDESLDLHLRDGDLIEIPEKS